MRKDREKLRILLREKNVLCSAICTAGTCEEFIRLEIDREAEPRMVLTRGTTGKRLEPCYPVHRAKDGLCYFHKLREEGWR